MNKVAKIVVTKDGPYLVTGDLPVDRQIIGVDEDNNSDKWIKAENGTVGESFALCHCGGSENKPFCDGTHIEKGFNDGYKSLK